MRSLSLGGHSSARKTTSPKRPRIVARYHLQLHTFVLVLNKAGHANGRALKGGRVDVDQNGYPCFRKTRHSDKTRLVVHSSGEGGLITAKVYVRHS